MDTSILHSISTVLMLLAFIGICVWTFSPSRRQKFKEAAQLPFSDDDQQKSKNDDSELNKESEAK